MQDNICDRVCAVLPRRPAFSEGVLAGAAVLTLFATALNITSVIMTQGQPAAADPEVVLAPDHNKQPVCVQTKPRETPIPVAQAVVPETTQNTAPSSPSAPLLQTNGQVPKSPQSPPPPTADPDNGSNPQIQQFSPEGRSAVDAAQPSPADASSARNEPVDQQSAPRSVTMSQGQPQVPAPTPQTTHAPLHANATPRHTGHQAPVHAVPSTPSSATASSGSNVPALRTTIRNELAKATIRFTEKAIEHALFSNNTATAPTTTTTGAADILLAMATDTGAGTTDCGDSAAAY